MNWSWTNFKLLYNLSLGFWILNHQILSNQLVVFEVILEEANLKIIASQNEKFAVVKVKINFDPDLKCKYCV